MKDKKKKPPYPHLHPHEKPKNFSPKLVAWEITRSCNLACVHCRASADKGPYAGELNTESSFKLLDQIADTGSPIIILTGGEPLLRLDIFEIAKYGTRKKLRMVMALNGTLINKINAKKMVNSGIKRISISLDGASKDQHDKFRGVEGAFEGALKGINLAKENGLKFQINTTITKMNLDQIPYIFELAENLGAVAHHIFLLVPTGRGKYLLNQEINAKEYENTLNWFYDQRYKTSLQLKATCAPHYYRILRQKAKKDGEKVTFESHGLDAVTKGCLAGTGFCFISHRGIVQPCGFLHKNCGNVTQQSFTEIWNNSEVFASLRNLKKLTGKCSYCKYIKICGGCRARAYKASGDYLSEEPLCTYKPFSNKNI